MSLTAFRQAVYGQLVDQFPDATVLGMMPDDLPSLPAMVVARPDAVEGDAPTVFEASLQVFVLGNRNYGAGIDRQLDETVDAVILALGGSRLATFSGIQMQVVGVEPVTTSVAGLEYPAYTVDVSHAYRVPECATTDA